ncbi:MAG: hypothetical protein WD847_13510 [Pirellulales bacterium]
MNLEQLIELLDPDVDCDPEDREAYLHFRSLGLAAAGEYRQWCQRHGFSTRLTKSWRERLRERAFLFRPVAEARLAQRKRELRAPEKVIRAIFQGQLVEDQLVAPYFKEICRACQAAKQRPNYERNLFRLLMHATRHASLLAMEQVVPRLGRQEGNTFVGGLAALARHSASWLRDVENWRPRTHSPRRKFSSLARHLFADWPVPLFMDSVWFKGASSEALRQQGWFLHLGRGENIRTADLPLPYTKKMSHYFMQAPSELSVEGALRWGQVHALGGSGRLARAIVGTWLETDLEHDDFVLSVLRFLLANPTLDKLQVRRLADYIHDVKPAGIARSGPWKSKALRKGGNYSRSSWT